MSNDNFKILENDAGNIEEQLANLFDYFENEIINLVDQINILKEQLDAKDEIIAEKDETIDVLTSKLQNIHNIMSGAMKRDIVGALKTEINVSNKNDNTQVVNDDTQHEKQEQSIEKTNDEVEQNFESVQETTAPNTQYMDNTNKIENSYTSDIVDVDEDEDPFSSASDDDWDKDINTVNNIENTTEDLSKEDVYEDEYILNEDDTDSFLFEDEK